MKIRHLIAAALLFLSLGAPTCATTDGAEKKCEDYKPLAACSLEFEYVCQTTPEGCEECSCVPAEDRNGVGPERPYDPMHP